MLDSIRNTQNLADIFKGFVLSAKTVDKAARIAPLRTIQELEKCGWSPRAMEDALSQVGIKLDETGLDFQRKGKEAFADIERAIEIYFNHVGYKRNPFSEIYNLEEAAEYLGIAKDTMYKYVIRQKRLVGRKYGTNHLFSRQQLDEFKKTLQALNKPSYKQPVD